MPFARLGSKLVYFAHIPKTGGTSIEAYLATRGRVAMHHNKSGGWLQCSPQHIHAGIYDALFGEGFVDHAFAVLRDPVERLKSEYRHRIGRARARGREIDRFDTWAPRVLKLSRRKPYVFDNHLRAQSAFVTPGMTLFRFEDGLDAVFDWIDGICGAREPAERVWKRNLSHVPVEAAAETVDFIRAFYREDCQRHEELASRPG